MPDPTADSEFEYLPSQEPVEATSPEPSSGIYSFLQRVYRRYLKPIPAVRSLVIYTWQTTYPVYLKIKRISHLSMNNRITIIPRHESDRLRSLHPISRGRLLLQRVYRQFLKPIPVVRATVIWAWQTTYPLYNKITLYRQRDPEARKWRSLVKYSSFSQLNEATGAKLAHRGEVTTPAPAVIPAEYRDYIPLQQSFVVPPVIVRQLRSGMINGGSNLLRFGEQIVCHDLFDVKHDYTSEELHGRALISVSRSRIRWLVNDPSPLHLSVAAPFVDACAHNYAHWLTEVLPRIALYCGEERFADVPIVVNSGLHRNILESLLVFTGEKREIIALPVGRSIAADLLHVTSVAGYVPFERRKGSGPEGHSQGRFHPCAFAKIRNGALPTAVAMTAEPNGTKIYIKRNSGGRKVINGEELEAALLSRGFTVIEPEKLSFREQVRIFANARMIVGSSGAALANIIFANKATRIYIMIGRYRETSFWYWQNIAAAVGNRVSYVFGEVEHNGGAPIHADFRIDIPLLLKELDQ